MAEKPVELAEAKRRQRRELFAYLKTLPEGEKATASERIRAEISGRTEFQKAAVVAAFVALPSEPDLNSLMEVGRPDRSWCLPLVNGEGLIEMRRFSRFEDLVLGEFGIREPDPAVCPPVRDEEIDLILLPGVGFDAVNRARLGRGKGHYDRFLEQIRSTESPPPVWGICFSGQLISIEPESHDQPMDAIVTEEGIQ